MSDTVDNSQAKRCPYVVGHGKRKGQVCGRPLKGDTGFCGVHCNDGRLARARSAMRSRGRGKRQLASKALAKKSKASGHVPTYDEIADIMWMDACANENPDTRAKLAGVAVSAMRARDTDRREAQRLALDKDREIHIHHHDNEVATETLPLPPWAAKSSAEGTGTPAGQSPVSGQMVKH